MDYLKDKKIAVVGVGGVGGYLAGMLLREFPHVTVCARGERGAAIEANGLILHSEYKGESVGRPEMIVKDTRDLEPQDYIFVCVKNYSLEQACSEMKNAVTKDTVIIPVMNGADPAERTRNYLPGATVIDSVIYIVAYALEDYSITQQGMYSYLKIGMEKPNEEERRKIGEVENILKLADVDVEAPEDIQAAIWNKYIFNCAYNVITAYYNENIGQLRKSTEKTEEFKSLLEEAYQVALSKNIAITRADIDHMNYRFREELAEGATSSLQRDLYEGKMTEVDTFGGYLVGEAHKAGIAVPVSERMYEGTKHIIRQMAEK